MQPGIDIATPRCQNICETIKQDYKVIVAKYIISLKLDKRWIWLR